MAKEDDIDLERAAVDLTGTISSAIPGTPGHVISSAASVVSEQYAVADDIKKLRKAGITEKDLQRSSSRAARRKLQSFDDRPIDVLKKGLVMTAGGALGAWLGAITLGFLPLGALIGGLVGSIGGGFVAGMIYEGTCDTHEQDCVNVIADSHRNLCKQEPLSEEKAAVILLTHLPPKLQNRYADKLERLTDGQTRDFAEAIQTPKGARAVLQVLSSLHAQDAVRGYAGMPIDPAKPDKRAEQQLTELANNGVDLRLLITDPHAFSRAAERYYRQRIVQDNGGVIEQQDVMSPQQLPTRAIGRELT